MENVTKEICNYKCEQTSKELAKITDTVEKNREDIVDLKKLMERLTALLESSNERIKTLEEKSTSFLDTDNGKFLVKFFAWLLAFIVVAALANKFIDPSIFIN